MKIAHYEEMKKVCETRGWNVDGSINEVETHIANNGLFNSEVLYYQNREGQTDTFLLEQSATALFGRGEEEKVAPWEKFDEMEAEGWEFFEIVDEPLYRFS